VIWKKLFSFSRQRIVTAPQSVAILDGGRLDPTKSRYARYLLDALKAKGQGRVLNRQEILTPSDPGVEYFVSDIFASMAQGTSRRGGFFASCATNLSQLGHDPR
jgi:hypothetical protein